MWEAGVSFLSTWQNFYVIIGSAAATLTGLMFVALTLYTRLQIEVSSARAGLEAFATPTVVHFCAALLVAAILSAPWQALWTAGLMLGLSGLGGVAFIVIAFRWGRRQTGYRPHLGDRLWYTVFPLILYAGLIVAGILLPGSPVPALFVIGAVAVLLLFIGIRNAWDSVTYLAIERSQPEIKNQD